MQSMLIQLGGRSHVRQPHFLGHSSSTGSKQVVYSYNTVTRYSLEASGDVVTYARSPILTGICINDSNKSDNYSNSKYS